MKVLELHLHTFYSQGDRLKWDGLCSPEDMILECIRKGYDGAAITDHNTTRGFRRAQRFVEKKFPEFLLIPGIELDVALPSNSIVHLLLYNEDVENLKFKRGERIEEVLDKAREDDTLVVAAHPLSTYNPFKRSQLRKFDKIDCLEVYNPFIFSLTPETEKLAKELGKGMVAGSDAHSLDMVGIACTIVKGESLEEILKNLRERESPILVTQGYRAVTPVLKWFKDKISVNYERINELVRKLVKGEVEPQNTLEKFVKRFHFILNPMKETLVRNEGVALWKLIAYPVALETKIYSKIVTR